MNRAITISLLLATLLTGCESVPEKVAAPAPKPVAVKLPFPKPVHAPPVQLGKDLVYDYLVAEIASREGDFATALNHYLEAAVLARDPYAAERATRIALHLNDLRRGLQAARIWVELKPNAVPARLLYGVLFLRNGQPQAAEHQLQALLKITDAEGKDGLLQIAAVLNSERDAADALKIMTSLVAQRSGDPTALYALALVQFDKDQYVDAASNLDRAIKLKPAWALPRVLLSHVLEAEKKSDQAIADMATAIRQYPKESLLRLEYARLLLERQRYAEALVQFRVLHKLLPNDPDVALRYAILATEQKHWEEARKLWNGLLKNPDFHDEANYFMGEVEQGEGHVAKAIKFYEGVGDGNLKPDAVIRASALLARQGKLKTAIETLGDARIAYPERAADLYLAEGLVLQQAHAPVARVERLYGQALKAFPGNIDLLYNRGLYYANIGRFGLMEKDLKAVLKADPDNADALNALGYTLADNGQHLDEAYRYITRALKLNPRSPEFLDSLGWVYYRKGDYVKAVRYLREALSSDPDDEIAAHLVQALLANGERGKARRLWCRASSKDPKSAALRALRPHFKGH